MKYIIPLTEDYRTEGGYPLSDGGIEAISNQFRRMREKTKEQYPKSDEAEIRDTLAKQYKVMIMPQ